MEGDNGIRLRVEARRERHRRRSWAVRALAVVAGLLATPVGFVLLLPLPEVGLPLLLGGLGLLALEFDWAVRALARVVAAAERIGAWWERRPLLVRGAVLLALAAVGIAVVLLIV